MNYIVLQQHSTTYGNDPLNSYGPVYTVYWLSVRIIGRKWYNLVLSSDAVIFVRAVQILTRLASIHWMQRPIHIHAHFVSLKQYTPVKQAPVLSKIS